MNRMDPVDTIKLQVPAKAEYVDVVRLALYGIASKIGFSYEDIEDMKVAVSEACNNVVLHAYGGAEGWIDLTFEHTDTFLQITVKDQGISFEHERRIPPGPTPLAGMELGQIREGGLGIFLMQALMDEVIMRTDRGTEVVMIKKRTGSESLS